jgi:hypothetical protein
MGCALTGEDDSLVAVGLLLDLITDCGAFVGVPNAPRFGVLLHAQTSTGRPLGPDALIRSLERRVERVLKHWRPHPKPQERDHSGLDPFEDRREVD